MMMCQWFLFCTNEAVGTMPHPLLGDVPICERCAGLTLTPDAFAAWRPEVDA